VLEVDTPMLSASATVDPNIDSFVTHSGRWLQTSPEFAMKRLLAAGSGQFIRLRGYFDWKSRTPAQSEFTLLEWYRQGGTYRQLMEEVQQLLIEAGIGSEQFLIDHLSRCFQAARRPRSVTASPEPNCCKPVPMHRTAPQPSEAAPDAQRDFWLDLLMSAVSGHAWPHRAAIPVRFPASQAALARRAPGPSAGCRTLRTVLERLEAGPTALRIDRCGEQRPPLRVGQQRRGARRQLVPPYE